MSEVSPREIEDISERWVQGIIRQALREYVKRVASDDDNSSDHAGAPNEASQEEALGDDVRQKRYLDEKNSNTIVVEERDGQRYYYIEYDLGIDIFKRVTGQTEEVSIYDLDR